MVLAICPPLSKTIVRMELDAEPGYQIAIRLSSVFLRSKSIST
jgi:hypothetical protein